MCKYYILELYKKHKNFDLTQFEQQTLPQNLPFEKNPSKKYHMLAHSLKSIHNSFKINKVQMIKL